MSTDTQVLVVKTEKTMGIAYALLIFLGGLGLHRFYLEKPGTGVIMLIMGFLGVMTAWLVVGFALLVPLWIWQVIDLFLVPAMVRNVNDKKFSRSES